MRIREIKALREKLAKEIQSLPEGDYSATVGKEFTMRPKLSFRRRFMRKISNTALRLSQNRIQKTIETNLNFDYSLLSIGERFANDACWEILFRNLPNAHNLDVLVPGCYMGGEDVQFWLRQGVHRLAGIDVFSLDEHWRHIVPELQACWPTMINFRQASMEALPFDDATFDVIASDAVLEHVRNLDAMVAETARVLKPGGYALHTFGPLYFSYGADHCISAYGESAGYDHLLLDEHTYRARISDRAFFAKGGAPDLAFWALHDQFSFATAADYLDLFSKHFELLLIIAKCSPQALHYRKTNPESWIRLLDLGISECDLITKGLSVVLRKR
jgi:SAM-dependent methyltransferase